MSTTVTEKEKQLFKVLVNHANCIDWIGVANVAEMDSSFGEYVDKAMQLIPKGSNEYYKFNEAVRKSIPCAKRIHYHWLIKSLASLIKPDDNGNVVSPLMILLINQQKRKNKYLN